MSKGAHIVEHPQEFKIVARKQETEPRNQETKEPVRLMGSRGHCGLWLNAFVAYFVVASVAALVVAVCVFPKL